MNKSKTKPFGIVQSIRNASRFKEILSVFIKHGFEEFVLKSKLHEHIPDFVFPASKKEKLLSTSMPKDQWTGVAGYRLRLVFEELGPAFIKFGQLLGTRDDFFDSSFTSEMKKLQDNVRAIDWSQAKDIIEKCWKAPFLEICKEVNNEAIASASIASVFTATLKNGDKVVIKVKRPGIDHVIESDFQLMKVLVKTLESTSEQFKWFAMSRTLEEFHRAIKNELNLMYELRNLERLSVNLSKLKDTEVLKLPEPYRDLSNENVLVMEFLDGVPFSKLTPDDVTPKLKQSLMQCVQLFMNSMLRDGFFHADLHGGNFLRLQNGAIGVVDFGLVGTLSQKNKKTFMSLLYNLSTGDFDRLTYELLDVAEYDNVPDYQELSRDLENALSPFLFLNSSQIPSAEFMQQLVSILAKHRLFLPREWSLIFRALVTLDGVGRTLGLDIKVFEILDKSTKEFATVLINKDQIIIDALWFLKDSMGSLRMLPKHVDWFLREFSKNNYSFDIRVRGLGKEIQYAAKSIQILSLVVLSCSFIFAGIFFIENKDVNFSSLPSMTVFFWSVALASLVLAGLLAKNRK